MASHPFRVISTVGCIVCAFAFTLLGCLIAKGWQTNNMRGYTLIYLLLFNMTLIWACQVPINWLQPIDENTSCPKSVSGYCYYFKPSVPKLLSTVKLSSISVFLFSLQYYKVVTNVIG